MNLLDKNKENIIGIEIYDVLSNFGGLPVCVSN
jgi:hypothetical protein